MRVIIVGSGRLAYQCAKVSKDKGFDTNVVEYKIADVSVLEKMCSSGGIDYRCLNKKDLHDYLLDISEKSYVFSLMNTYLFPADVIDNSNLVIVNAHNSILPDHGGRNAEAWEIFDQDEEAAVTWHYVTTDVDGGNIIAQRRFEVEDNWTAIQLLQYQNRLEAEMFEAVLDKCEKGEAVGTKQDKITNKRFHYSYDIPNEGRLDLAWPIDKIYAFLRAMDYGPLKLLGEPFVEIDGKSYVWKKYSAIEEVDSEDCTENVDNDIVIIRNKKMIRLVEASEK